MSDRPDGTEHRALLESAYLELRKLRSELEAVEESGKEPIAIVGAGCRLPQAGDPRAFWRLLCEGGCVITEVPPERWDVGEYFDPDAKARGKISSRWGGFLEDLHSFDAAFFGISSREAPHVDPRQRLLLEVAWEALEDAGIPPHSLAGSRTGVYVATLTSDYDFCFNSDNTLRDSFTGAGTADSVVANRISYFLDLKGPSLTLDTACSGSLLTVELACRSLRLGETTLALAGGVSVNLLPAGDIFFSRAGALSPDGRCRSFDRDANGIVRGEGAGIVALKTLSRALADGDRIYALIRGGAVNHNGRSNGIMAPNGLAQEALLREAYRQARVSPGRVQYVEAHGTGTRLGDPIEANSLAEVLAAGRTPERPCLLGSVKTNVGHLEAAAGVVGLIKTALSLHHRLIPPTPHFKQLNPLIRDAGFPLRVPQQLERWPAEDETLIAGVSSFGFGGTNVHLVLEEAPRPSPAPEETEDARAAYILPLSARGEAGLRAAAEVYQRFLSEDEGGHSLSDICYTASVRRGAHEHRLAVVGRSREELIAGLETFKRSENTRNASRGVGARPGKLVYVFSGQGTHWSGMGRRLLEEEPVFRHVVEECERLLSHHVSWSLTEQLCATDGASRLIENDIAQPAIFVVQVALAALWRSWGIAPDVVVGQSLGEVAAGHVAGALSLEDAVQVVFHRSRLMKQLAGQGGTAVVGLSAQQTRAVLADFADTLAVAGSVGPSASVISGDPSALEEVLQSLRARDVLCRPLENGGLAFHSPQMNGIKSELTRSLESIRPARACVRLLSTVTGTHLAGEELDAVYWGRNLREPFCFSEVITNLINEGYDSFLEISPHPAAVGPIRQCLAQQERDGLVTASLVREQDERSAMLSSLARLYTEGYDVRWEALYPAGGRCVSLPTYPWRRERYWYDQLENWRAEGRTANFGARMKRSGHSLLGERFRSALPSGQQFWETDFSSPDLLYLRDHCIGGAVVLPGAAYLEMALAAAAQAFGGGACTVESLSFERALLLPEQASFRVQSVLSPGANGAASFEVHSTQADAEDGSGVWTLHACGLVRRLAPDESSSAAESVSPAEVQASFTEAVSVDEHYAAMHARQLRYGPGFRTVRELWHRDGEALSLCALDEDAGAGVESYQVHPALLDAAFQTVAAALTPGGDELYLPRRVERLRVRQRPGNRAWCRARVRADAQPGSSLLKADILVFDEEGRVLVEVEGLCLQRFDAARQARVSDPRDCLYELQWQPEPAAEINGRKSKDRPAAYVIFTDGGELGERLAALAEARSERCVRVYPARRYRVSDDRRSCWIDPREPKHFSRLFADVLTDDLPAPRAFVHLWGAEAAAGEETTPAGLEAAHAHGGQALLYIIQALTAAKTAARTHGAARLWVATNRAQAVGPSSSGLSFAQTSLWGIGRVVALEHTELWGRLVDLEGDDPRRDAELLDAEMSAAGAEKEVAYRAGLRHVARLRRAGQTLTPRPYQFRADASYLVTGGLSGLGLETARWMAACGARHLVLLSRTGLPPRSSWRRPRGDGEAERVASVLELERMGASVQVCAADVADEAQLREFFENQRAESRPPIRGIVHSAGVVSDQLLLRLSAEAFREVLAPKVYGGWLLHLLTRREELDFFVMFSSATSILGRAGQANYAAANAFLDGLAHYRRGLGLPALSINWGPWAEVGMYARAGLSGRADAGGVGEIDPKQGAELLSLLVGSDAAEVLALNADWTKFEAVPLLSELASEQSGDGLGGEMGAGQALEMLLADEAARRAMLGEYLRKILGRVLRCDAGRVDTGSVLTNLGMDSIMAVEVKMAIQTDLNLSVSLADLFTESVSGLVEKLDEQLRNDETLAAAVAEIEQLSMDEVRSQLGGAGRRAEEDSVEG
jgi:acyl transferase domain-containing protein/acyl carrier protein